MGLFRQAMTYYAFVFHPATVIGAGVILLISEEWTEQQEDLSVLWRRVGAFLGVGVLAFVPTVAYFALGRGGLDTALEGSTWRLDMLVASGLFIAAGLLWYLWRYRDWGRLVPAAMEVLAAVLVPYTLLSPFWNVSGHVILAVMPTLYLTLVDRRYWPLLAIPVLMIPNRVVLNAHSLTQSVVGFLVAVVLVWGLYRLQTGRKSGRGPHPLVPEISNDAAA